MIAEYKTKTNVGIGLGIVTVLGCSLLMKQSGPLAQVASVLVYAGPVLCIYGYSNYAIGKGHSGWWGILGLFRIFGLIGLVCLPDKHKNG